MGKVNFYDRFLQDRAEIFAPLYALLQKGVRFDWTDSCQAAFNEIKRLLTSDQVLIHYSLELPLCLSVDAGPLGLGAVLAHEISPGVERPVAYASRTLTTAERNYSQFHKELLALKLTHKLRS